MDNCYPNSKTDRVTVRVTETHFFLSVKPLQEYFIHIQKSFEKFRANRWYLNCRQKKAPQMHWYDINHKLHSCSTRCIEAAHWYNREISRNCSRLGLFYGIFPKAVANAEEHKRTTEQRLRAPANQPPMTNLAVEAITDLIISFGLAYN